MWCQKKIVKPFLSLFVTHVYVILSIHHTKIFKRKCLLMYFFFNWKRYCICVGLYDERAGSGCGVLFLPWLNTINSSKEFFVVLLLGFFVFVLFFKIYFFFSLVQLSRHSVLWCFCQPIIHHLLIQLFLTAIEAFQTLCWILYFLL